jgi:NADH-quinone oxidoreductase subunit H
VMTAMIFPRGVVPRVRIDTLLRTGWTRLLVIGFANIFFSMLLVSLGLVHIGGA